MSTGAVRCGVGVIRLYEVFVGLGQYHHKSHLEPTSPKLTHSLTQFSLCIPFCSSLSSNYSISSPCLLSRIPFYLSSFLSSSIFIPLSFPLSFYSPFLPIPFLLHCPLPSLFISFSSVLRLPGKVILESTSLYSGSLPSLLPLPYPFPPSSFPSSSLLLSSLPFISFPPSLLFSPFYPSLLPSFLVVPSSSVSLLSLINFYLIHLISYHHH